MVFFMLISFLDKVKNIVGKGEIAGDQHFHLFQNCFQKASCQGPFKSGLCSLTHSHTMTPFDAPGKQAF